MVRSWTCFRGQGWHGSSFSLRIEASYSVRTNPHLDCEIYGKPSRSLLDLFVVGWSKLMIIEHDALSREEKDPILFHRITSTVTPAIRATKLTAANDTNANSIMSLRWSMDPHPRSGTILAPANGGRANLSESAMGLVVVDFRGAYCESGWKPFGSRDGSSRLDGLQRRKAHQQPHSHMHLGLPMGARCALHKPSRCRRIVCTSCAWLEHIWNEKAATDGPIPVELEPYEPTPVRKSVPSVFSTQGSRAWRK